MSLEYELVDANSTVFGKVLSRSIWTPVVVGPPVQILQKHLDPSEIFGPPNAICSHFEPWEPVGLLCRLLGRLSKLVTLKVRIKMSVTGVEAQTARSKHRNYERTEQHCEIKAPNKRTEQRESDGDGDDMEVDILHHAHV